MKKIYRTSRGTPIDIDALRIKFENEIAVGNMKVNARGDTIGKKGQIVEPVKNKAVATHKTPKAIRQTSLKPDSPEAVQREMAKTTIEGLQSTGSTKIAPNQSKKKQVKLANGDIIMVDEDQDPNESVDD